MAKRINPAIESMRQKALDMLKRVRELEAKEKQKIYFDLGTITLKYLEGNITLQEFKTGVKTLTGLEFKGEVMSNKTFSQNEVDNAVEVVLK